MMTKMMMMIIVPVVRTRVVDRHGVKICKT